MTTAAHAAATKAARSATRAIRETTTLPLFEPANARIAELLARMNQREQHISAIEDRLRRTMEALPRASRPEASATDDAWSSPPRTNSSRPTVDRRPPQSPI